DIEAVDKGVVDFDRDGKCPSAFGLGAATENQTRNAILAAACRVGQRGEANPGQCRVVDEVVTAGNSCAQGNAVFRRLHFATRDGLKLVEIVGHRENGKCERVVR